MNTEIALELPEESFFIFRYIYVNGEFLVYTYINITSICENVFALNCEKKRNAVIFKFLKYTVPSLARFKDSLIPIVPIVGSIFLFKKGKCPQSSNVLNVELLA